MRNATIARETLAKATADSRRRRTRFGETAPGKTLALEFLQKSFGVLGRRRIPRMRDAREDLIARVRTASEPQLSIIRTLVRNGDIDRETLERYLTNLAPRRKWDSSRQRISGFVTEVIFGDEDT